MDYERKQQDAARSEENTSDVSMPGARRKSNMYRQNPCRKICCIDHKTSQLDSLKNIRGQIIMKAKIVDVWRQGRY